MLTAPTPPFCTTLRFARTQFFCKIFLNTKPHVVKSLYNKQVIFYSVLVKQQPTQRPDSQMAQGVVVEYVTKPYIAQEFACCFQMEGTKQRLHKQLQSKVT